MRIIAETFVNLHAIEQIQFWGQRRVDSIESSRHRDAIHSYDVGRLKFDFHTGDEAQDEENESRENDDEAKRRALDQAWYERRLAPLMARADGAKAPVVNDAAVARVGDADDGGVDIAAALAARERKDKEKAAAAAAMLPIDDDLSDDDLNEALWNQPRYTVPGFQKGQ